MLVRFDLLAVSWTSELFADDLTSTPQPSGL
jgi:hypothetical protein